MAYTVKQVAAMSGVSVRTLHFYDETSHVWGCPDGKSAKILDVYQPAGQMEDFFRAVGKAKNLPTREHALSKTYTEEQIIAVHELLAAYGMDLLGPPHLADEQ